ncbi:hypothetical protein KKH56_05105 [bacterium]|nr:hypothetical protein [bacterium]
MRYKGLIFVGIVVSLLLAGMVSDVLRAYLVRYKVERSLKDSISEGLVSLNNQDLYKRTIETLARKRGILLGENEVEVSGDLSWVRISHYKVMKTWAAWIFGKSEIHLNVQVKAKILKEASGPLVLCQDPASLGIKRPKGLNYGLRYELSKEKKGVLSEALVALVFVPPLKVGDLVEIGPPEIEEASFLSKENEKETYRYFKPASSRLLRMPVVQQKSRTEAEVVGFASFFLEKIEGDSFLGRFIIFYEEGSFDKEREVADFGLRAKGKVSLKFD